MDTLRKLSVIVLCSLLICASSAKVRYRLAGDYLVTIHGTSNLHNWKEKVGMVSGDVLMNTNSDGSYDLDAVSMQLDVRSIKSEKGVIMNKNTYKALKVGAYPQILFNLRAPLKGIRKSAEQQAVLVKGDLSIAGVTKTVEMQVNIWLLDNGRLFFEGSQKIKMTDFNIQPPIALLGTLKTGNEIIINFKTSFDKKID